MTDKEIRRLRAERRQKIAWDNYAIIQSERKLEREEVISGVIRRMYSKGQSAESIADLLDEPIDKVKKILKLNDETEK